MKDQPQAMYQAMGPQNIAPNYSFPVEHMQYSFDVSSGATAGGYPSVPVAQPNSDHFSSSSSSVVGPKVAPQMYAPVSNEQQWTPQMREQFAMEQQQVRKTVFP